MTEQTGDDVYRHPSDVFRPIWDARHEWAPALRAAIDEAHVPLLAENERLRREIFVLTNSEDAEVTFREVERDQARAERDAALAENERLRADRDLAREDRLQRALERDRIADELAQLRRLHNDSR